MTRPSDAAELVSADVSWIGSRYELHELIGRGGMACVYRATDHTLSRQVALKQLTLEKDAPHAESVTALFEREYQVLIQLSHPHVIEAYDFGVLPDASPFYTMELLDGGDLRDRSPVPWAEACRLAFDVCSALALLHSRHLLHRDVSPRNVRCTSAGQAKLIDFGAMVPMNARAGEVVGTPAFIAPETLQRLAVDARTDLFSLGVTFYYALTGRLPYPARTFGELLEAWRVKPLTPSALVADIPPALDDLLMALISVEPALRPSTANHVMQQLAACAGLRIEESDAVTRAYLSTPTLVGRDAELAAFKTRLQEARKRPGGGIMIQTAPGLGRSRLLDAFALEAQSQRYTVLRASASGTREPFAVARGLATHLLDAQPLSSGGTCPPELCADTAQPANQQADARSRIVLGAWSGPDRDPGAVQAALRKWFVEASRSRPLLLVVDDVHRIDQPSAALLAELIDAHKEGGILVVLAADEAEREDVALQVLARRCKLLTLAPLSREHTRRLLDSLFGDTPNLEMLAEEIQRIALGNPRHTLELAEHLVQRGTIRYAAGSWIVPSALSSEDLPPSAAAALRARLERLTDEARRLAEAQVLAFSGTFSDADYRQLAPDLSAMQTEGAIAELLEAQVIIRDGSAYLIANRVWTQALRDALDPQRTLRAHRALAAMYQKAQFIGFIHHAFAANMDQEALQALDLRNTLYRSEADYRTLSNLNVGKLLWCYPRAIRAAQARGDTARQILDLRRWQYMCCLMTDEEPDRESARLWFEQIAHDSGLQLYREDTTTLDRGERLTKALQAAYFRYQATPEHERVYPVDEALRKLGEYVVISIALGARAMDHKLLRSLPEIVEPFVPLSPLLDAIWHNALATRDSHCRFDQARDRWRQTLEKLDNLPPSNETFVDGMRNAIAFGIGLMEAHLGLASAADWAERLERDALQRISALSLRKVVRLEQGDTLGADRLRRQAEVLALQLREPQMFKHMLFVEIQAYVNSRDMAGVAMVIEQLRPMAERRPVWRCNLEAAYGGFHVVRGDWERAKQHFERCSELTQPSADGDSQNLPMWLTAQAGLCECLQALGQDAQAFELAERALRTCEDMEIISGSFELVRRLALAEARLGRPGAAERLDTLIALQNASGCTGLRMGLSYEARARIAIWANDAQGFERFAELTAREYRHGARGSLAARYERLMNEAARHGMQAKLSLAEFEALASVGASAFTGRDLSTAVTRNLAAHRGRDERARAGLEMICAAHAASVGHLFLITPAGPVLAASLVESAPSASLLTQVSEYVARKQAHADGLDDMATGVLDEQEGTLVLSHTSRDTRYELLPLSSVENAASVLVGVAAIQVSEGRARNEKQLQLLSAIASSLAQHGDGERDPS